MNNRNGNNSNNKPRNRGSNKKARSEAVALDYDDTLGVKSLERVRSVVMAIPAERVIRVNIDLQGAAVKAWGVCGLLTKPEVRQRFEMLPRSLFDIDRTELMRDLVLAIWYARSTARVEAERASESKVSAALAEEGSTTKQRMTRVIQYVLAENEAAQAELARIRSGTGYMDMAADLTHLALLYVQHEAVLKQDTVWYRAEDVALARSIAKRILDQLGLKSDTDWTDLTARLWTLLREVYEEVRATGQFLFRGEALADEFVSLHAATRTRTRASSTEDDEDEGGDEDGENEEGSEEGEDEPSTEPATSAFISTPAASASPSAPSTTPALPGAGHPGEPPSNDQGRDRPSAPLPPRHAGASSIRTKRT